MCKKLSYVWIIRAITLEFHTQLSFLHRMDRFASFDPHITQFFAQKHN
jgi:hypothetical protein